MSSSSKPRRRTKRVYATTYRRVVCEGPEAAALDRSCNRPETVADLCSDLVSEAQEVFRVLLLNGKHRLLGMVDVSRGTLTQSLVHPREVFGPAIRTPSAAIIIVHNHPSGDPAPSVEDREVTRRLAKAGQLLGIPLLDHVVVAEKGYRSMREDGIIET